MWENFVQPDRPQMAVWRMCIVCCYKHTLTTCNTVPLSLVSPPTIRHISPRPTDSIVTNKSLTSPSFPKSSPLQCSLLFSVPVSMATNYRPSGSRLWHAACLSEREWDKHQVHGLTYRVKFPFVSIRISLSTDNSGGTHNSFYRLSTVWGQIYS